MKKRWKQLELVVTILTILIGGTCIVKNMIQKFFFTNIEIDSNFPIGIYEERKQVKLEKIIVTCDEITRKEKVTVIPQIVSGGKAKTIDVQVVKIEKKQPGKKKIFEITAYCPCEHCCGIGGGKATASGTAPKSCHTVAAPRSLKFGTKIYIPELQNWVNGGNFTIEDRGGDIKEGRLDIFFNTHEEAVKFGRHKDVEVYIYE